MYKPEENTSDVRKNSKQLLSRERGNYKGNNMEETQYCQPNTPIRA